GRALASDRAERRGEQPEDCNEPQERRAQPPRPRRRRVSRRAWSEGAQDPRRIPARSNLCRPRARPGVFYRSQLTLVSPASITHVSVFGPPSAESLRDVIARLQRVVPVVAEEVIVSLPAGHPV